MNDPLQTYILLSETFSDNEIDDIVNDQLNEEFVRKLSKYILSSLRNQNLVNNMKFHSNWWNTHKAGAHSTIHHKYADYARRRRSDASFYAGKLGAQKRINPKSEWMEIYRNEMNKAEVDANNADAHAQYHLDKTLQARYISKQWKNAATNLEQDDEAQEVPARFVKGYMTGEPYSPNPTNDRIDYSMLSGHIHRPAVSKPGPHRPGIKVRQKRRKGTEHDIARDLHKTAPADSTPEIEDMKRKVNENIISKIIKAKKLNEINDNTKTNDNVEINDNNVRHKFYAGDKKPAWVNAKTMRRKTVGPKLKPNNDRSEVSAYIKKESIEIDYE